MALARVSLLNGWTCDTAFVVFGMSLDLSLSLFAAVGLHGMERRILSTD